MFNIKLRTFVAFCAMLLHTAIYASDQEPFEQRKPQTSSLVTNVGNLPNTDIIEGLISRDGLNYFFPFLSMSTIIQASYTCKRWNKIFMSEDVWRPIAVRFPGYKWGTSIVSEKSSKEVVKLLIGIHYIYDLSRTL